MTMFYIFRVLSYLNISSHMKMRRSGVLSISVPPGRAAGDAFPEVGFLSRELRLHAPLHGEFRLTHVGTVAFQLHRAEVHELGEVVPLPRFPRFLRFP